METGDETGGGLTAAGDSGDTGSPSGSCAHADAGGDAGVGTFPMVESFFLWMHIFLGDLLLGTSIK